MNICSVIAEKRNTLARRILNARAMQREHHISGNSLVRLAIACSERPLPIHRMTSAKLVGRAVACVRTIRVISGEDVEGNTTMDLYAAARHYLRLAREVREIRCSQQS